LLPVVLDADLHVEPRVPTLGVAQLRLPGDETRHGLMSANGHDGLLLISGSQLVVAAVSGRCAPALRPWCQGAGRRRRAAGAGRSLGGWAASGRSGPAGRSVSLGGGERGGVPPLPQGRVRMRSGGKIETRRRERWFDRGARSPRVTLLVYSSRSPLSVDR